MYFFADLAPTFQNPPHAGQIELPSNGKILLCEAKGYPEPVYRWLKDGVFLSAQNDTSTLLVFKDLDRNDAGAYQCVASNNAGAIISKKAVLRVACKFTFFFINPSPTYIFIHNGM